MGIYDRPYYQDERGPGLAFSGRSMITNIIIVNVVVFLVDVFLFGNRGPTNRPSEWLAVHSDTLAKPWLWWQLLTYGFCHDYRSIGHIAGNMLGLFFLGQDIERHYGPKRFLQMYLTSLIFCSVIWCVTEMLWGSGNSRLVGASGAVTSVVLLFALNYPQRTILFMMFIPMPAWVLGVFIVVYNLFGAHGGQVGDRTAYDVHLAGALYGYLFFRTQFALGAWPMFGGGGSGGSGGRRVSYGSPSGGGARPGSSIFSKLRWPRSRPKLKVHHPEEQMTVLDEQADAVLEKLHREGLESLSPRERRILEEYSRRMQQKRR